MKARTPNPSQAAILEDLRTSNRLVIAGAGSGKTQTLIWQIMTDMENGFPTSKMVAITFTNAGADELRARLPGYRLGFVGTLHAYCLQIVNQYGEYLGYTAGKVAMIDEETEKVELERALAAIGKSTKQVPLSEVRKWKANPGLSCPAAVAARKYTQTLRAASCVDFDTVLIDALRIFQDNKPPQLACLYVDEFQDSAAIDAQIYEAMFVERRFFVGDPDQAIYPFRGGRVENILELAERDDWRTYFLNENHRSDRLIVDAANRLISSNRNRLEKSMVAVSQDNGLIEEVRFKTAIAEGAYWAMQIRQSALEDVAILVRYNHQIPTLVAMLQAEGLKVRYAKPESPQWLNLAISALNAINAPRNTMAAGLWIEHITKKEAEALGNRPASYWLDLEAAGGLPPVMAIMEAMGTDASHPGKALHNMGLPAEALHHITAAWQGTAEATIPVLRSVIEPTEEEAREGVYVGTVHSYKGKEADVVILAGMMDEVTPAAKTGGEVEEERRLMYVGITRGRKMVFISSSELYQPPFTRGMVISSPSRFIVEALA